uniref:Type IV pilin n=1 Tax=Archaeoglobus fulgidus TaxID=2234 RepID=A0A7C3RL89_ARCFL
MRRMDEKGVSPVIGVILMVAITVILAAVIASFVFSISPPTAKPPNVGLRALGGDGMIIIEHIGGEPLNCTDVTVYVDNNPRTINCGNDGWLTVGEEVEISADLGVRKVRIIHNPTNSIIFTATVQVYQTTQGGQGGGGAGDGGDGGGGP